MMEPIALYTELNSARFLSRAHRPVARVAALAMGLLLLGAVGCGDDATVAGEGADASVSEDVNTPLGDTEADTVATIDIVPADQTGGNTCPGAAGCACTEAKDCETGFCIPTPKGQFCAQKCEADECPADQKCVQAGTADVVNICVPKFAFLCNPCSANSQCQNQASPDAKCVDNGSNGSFCGTTCGADSDCADGYSCSEVKDITGSAAKQCVPKGAACECSAYAVAQQLSTACYVPTGDGKCAGKRTCLPAGAQDAPAGGGLSSCIAAEAKPEICDGADNDCDGQTDEGTCDDNNVCSTDQCMGAGGCSNTNNTGDCDADGSVCTQGDKCSDGKCVAGAAQNCDDQNPCTKDTCDPKEGCQHSPDEGAPCNADDNPCTVGDACAGSKCEAGGAKACSADDNCLQGKCDIADGACKYKFQEGSPCNDGNPCTEKENCLIDACKGAALSCDDQSVCTSDSCDPKSGCVHSNVAGVCDDGDKCTGSDSCDAGKCVGLALDVSAACDDKNACTTETCDPVKGCLSSPASGSSCDDGNPCTEADACKDGKCASDINKCSCEADTDCIDDGNLCNGILYCDKAAQPYVCKVKESSIVSCDASLNGECQSNTCDPGTGKCALQKKPDNLSCNADNNVCTIGDTCKSGLCSPGVVQTCDDKNPCTDDSCDPTKGCQFLPNAAPCDADDNLCTANDVCAQGACVAGKVKACDSGDACVLGKCLIITGKCDYKFQESAPCNDANPCTVGDTCQTDACKGAAANCDDANPCTSDACDPKSGCTHGPATGLCDDGNKCTALDSCVDSKCAGTPIDVAKECDDSNACTTDGCDAKAGCGHAPATGPCDDGNVCTKNDACAAGQCVSGTNTCSCQKDADCPDDGNLCNGTPYCDTGSLPFQCKVNPATVVACADPADPQCATVSCDAKTGKCNTVSQLDGSPCDADKNACTGPDKCASGLCVKGSVIGCDDKNPCTLDSCDPAAGCKYTNNTAPCDADNNACTKNDTCASGNCVAGAAQKCDDGEACTQDSCNTANGQCTYTPITTTCSDNNICTVGDQCGTDANTKAYTCIPGKAVSCDDNNPCTLNTCDQDKGCVYPIDATASVSCYSGPSGTSGKGICKPGKQTCDAQGKLSPCTGEVQPGPKELCNGQDDTCNGTTDEGCAPTSFVARVGNGTVSGAAGQINARVTVGMSQAVGATGGSNAVTAQLGFFAWIKTIIGL